ncbi:hypothetical protein FXN61_11925 [Lentzea sp. PSKA42]|uniref:Uncharacterized protein n=1 Tax=Lentzea indica TaxID=2604800 RepID=A0ABX1FEW6_9PSEU|nr:hypothetical protein [Lentzea indica]NKE57504.1 hypothetical protein [Lentzea indica]
MRDIVAVVVAVESPAGLLVDALNTLAAHLPPADRPMVCPLCPARSWPCAPFDQAARHVQDSGVAIGPFVPLDLHPQVWPPAP